MSGLRRGLLSPHVLRALFYIYVYVWVVGPIVLYQLQTTGFENLKIEQRMPASMFLKLTKRIIKISSQTVFWKQDPDWVLWVKCQINLYSWIPLEKLRSIWSLNSIYLFSIGFKQFQATDVIVSVQLWIAINSLHCHQLSGISVILQLQGKDKIVPRNHYFCCENNRQQNPDRWRSCVCLTVKGVVQVKRLSPQFIIAVGALWEND